MGADGCRDTGTTKRAPRESAAALGAGGGRWDGGGPRPLTLELSVVQVLSCV